MTYKKVINCPRCSKKVRVPIGKHIKFICPSCNEELEYDDRPENEKLNGSEAENLDGGFSIINTIINLISWVLAIPIFIIVHKLLPNPDWILNIDRILLGILLIFILKLILKKFRGFVIGGFLIAVIWLSYGSFWGNYGFTDVYRDYKEMIHSMANNPNPERIVISKLKPFKK